MLILHELSPSPNSTKVRMALRFKGIPFESREIDPLDRSPLVLRSGQEMAPVLEDPERNVVLPDSEAILHFLEANYPDTTKLLPPDIAARRECEQFPGLLVEKLARHWIGPFLYCIGRAENFAPDAINGFHEGLAWLQGELRDGHVRGADRPICDLRAAQWAAYALPGEALVQRCPIFAKFAETFAVEPGRFSELESFLSPWQERLG